MSDYIILGLAAFLAGLVDAVVGGGGLIQLPVLFSVFPQTLATTLFGTSKLAGVVGTATAAINYSKKIKVAWGAAIPAAAAAFVFAFLGAYTVTHISSDLLRRSLPFILLIVAIYTFKKKEFGGLHSPIYRGWKERILAVGIGSGIGFYDGFFGPGTGSFLVFLFIHYFRFDFIGASAVSKVVNVACNISALLWFGWSGHVLWKIGALMAICNVCGSFVGTHLAIQNGSQFVRKVFLIVVCLLIFKTGYDGFIK